MKLPFGLGELDFGDWIYGLVAAFIGGGASAVVSGITLNLVDPNHFNVRTGSFYVLVGAMFATNGLMNAMAFLRQKPLPEMKTVTTTLETKKVPKPGVVVTSTIQETHTEPLETATKEKDGHPVA